MKVVLDSDILIDLLQGALPARKAIASLTDVLVSTVSWVEALTGARDASEREAVLSLLSRWPARDVDREIAIEAASVRQEFRLKTPDALVLATARVEGRELLTRNIKDFSRGMPGVRVPYTL